MNIRVRKMKNNAKDKKKIFLKKTVKLKNENRI